MRYICDRNFLNFDSLGLGCKLSGIHSAIGSDAEAFGILRIVGEKCDAYARSDADRVSVYFESTVKELREGFADAHGVGVSHRFLENYREFIAAGPRNGIGPANPALKEIPHTLEQFIADVVAHAVIDLLEFVQIDQQQGGVRSTSPGAFESAGQPVLEEAAVGQSRQLIMQRQIFIVLDLILEMRKN